MRDLTLNLVTLTHFLFFLNIHLSDSVFSNKGNLKVCLSHLSFSQLLIRDRPSHMLVASLSMIKRYRRVLIYQLKIITVVLRDMSEVVIWEITFINEVCCFFEER